MFLLDCSNTAYLSICGGVYIQKDCTFLGKYSRQLFLYFDPKWSKLSTITVFVLLCRYQWNKICKSDIEFYISAPPQSLLHWQSMCMYCKCITTYLCKFCTIHTYISYRIYSICSQRILFKCTYKHVYINPSVHVYF